MTTENSFDSGLEFPSILGFGPSEAYRQALSVRSKPVVDGGIISLAATDHDYDVNANRSDIFAPYTAQIVPSLDVLNSASALYRPDLTQITAARSADTRFGYGRGRRHWLTLVTSADIIIKINDKKAKPFRWKTASGPLHLPVAEIYNLYLRADQSGGTAQQQVVSAVAASAITAGMYFIVPSTNASYIDKYFGLYFTKDGAGSQPSDARVTDWYAVAVTTGQTSTQVADAIEAVLEARTGYISTANNTGADITIVHTVSTAMTDAFDGTVATGMTFNAASTNGSAGQTATVDLLLI